MSFLSLKNIGKIYVNEGNVSVGIRGVDLDFERGEFVAITGESGSGKSTLLNVISGIDTYEEGEMYIEGEQTSHYIQSDYEEYRKKYISFIFQDYNIIESYTVLENVELALMHIENKKQRRQKALELIDRVGLGPWKKHRGSKLSGGQKQRTVIARALAKDSPVILADEPTGNLDAATSKEILKLLKEVSVGKLLIIVTHNFEEVEEYATRHIRIYNSKVVSDNVISEPNVTYTQDKGSSYVNENKNSNFKNFINLLKNGITLGVSIFKSTPFLSTFTVFLMFICTLGLMFVTSVFYEAFDLVPEYNLFTEVEGRVVFVSRDNTPIGEEEIKRIAEKYSADDYFYNDAIFDYKFNTYYDDINQFVSYSFEYIRNDITPQFGRIPEKIDEIMLYIPIGLKTVYGEDLADKTITLNEIPYNIVGVSYFYDNTKDAKIITTKEGFEFLSYLFYYDPSNVMITVNNKTDVLYGYREFIIDFSQEGEYIALPQIVYNSLFNSIEAIEAVFVQMNLSQSLHGNNYYNIPTIAYETIAPEEITLYDDLYVFYPKMSADMFIRIVKENALKDYKQGSLFFNSKKDAQKAISQMNNEGYVAVMSDSTYTPDILTVILSTVTTFFNGLLWLMIVFFLSFFVGLCLSRSISSFKHDLPIMRSMGIPVKIIKIGVYTKLFISQIIALIPALIVAVVVFMTPKLNLMFTFLSPTHYILIFIGVMLMSIRITKKQIKKLFSKSVKSALKGGNE